MKLLRRYPEIIILATAALITRLWDVFAPAAVVFDEVYFKVYAGDYLTGSYYFDPHPPLGKLLLGGWAWLAHLNPTMLTGNDPAVALRVLPAIAGALIIPVFYLFLRQLRASRRVAALGAALLLLDNALLVESRFILIDSLLILFGLTAVTCFLAARHRSGRRRLLLLSAAAACGGLAASTKWTGLAALGLIGVIWLTDHLRHHQYFSWTKRLIEALILAIVPAIVYLSVFAIHFSLLPKTGQGDAFMPQRFQSTLIGNPNYNPTVHLSFVEKFIDLNNAMSQSEEGLKTATHPYGSKWTSWPLMIRPVYYWQGQTQPDGTQGNIYLLGNPAVWYGLLIVIVAGMLASAGALARLRPYRFALGFLALGYLMNFLPFSRIVRVMFLYHYFFALIYSLAFAVILLGALADWMHDRPHPWQFSTPTSKYLYIGVLILAVIGFIYFAPLSYGIPLTPAEIAQHMWLTTWR
ncbi:MAG TPA: phospholipid carrier-dependent glycosyltransferase [Candidatus Saccharimonadia bacterium]|nr:phospholipid carrier-dependent glycosyltransferase [Candidatus Saccharimonadia bacterium]